MVLQGEVFEIALAQLPPNRRSVGGTVEIQPQQLGLGPLPQPRLPRLLPLLGAAVPALTLDLLAEVVLQLDRHAGLTTRQPLGHPLQVVAANGALGEFAQQGHQVGNGLLELVGLTQIPISQHLLDLPIQPKGGLIQEGAVVASAVVLEEVVGVLA